MTRNELVETLAKCLAFPISKDWKIAVLMPTHSDCKFLSNLVADKLGELPAWVGINFLKVRTSHEIRSDHGHVMFVSDTVRLKGHTLNLVYRSNRIDMHNNHDAEFYAFLSALSGQSIQDFDDE